MLSAIQTLAAPGPHGAASSAAVLPEAQLGGPRHAQEPRYQDDRGDSRASEKELKEVQRSKRGRQHAAAVIY